MGWITVIGAGPGDPTLLTLRAYELLREAKVVVCREDLAQCFPDLQTIVPLPGKLSKMLQVLEDLHRKYREVVLLLSGDSTLFSLIKHLPEEWVKEIVPGISVLQYFCARLRIARDHLALLNLHAKEDFSELRFVLEEGRGGLVLSGDSSKTSKVLALVQRVRPGCEVVVGGDLSLPGEKIIKGKPEEVKEKLGGNRFHVVYFPFVSPSGITFFEDEEFVREKIPLTKKENRMLIISILELSPGMQVLEVGSGSGGVTVEIARRIGGGTVFAVERDERALFYLNSNLERFGISNVRLIRGEAPQAIPRENFHRVFIGGSGGRLASIMERAFPLLVEGGIMAFVAITLETLEEGVQIMKKMPFRDFQIVEQNVTRFEERGGRRMVHSLNSIFLVWGRKDA
ncbi:precorrin-6Y C5,15-methyltransferase (decarboxylating) subunit CbiT [Atrimonas thermophila]|uniref:precorrin-6Y C5,15-methyltransferase (decarboxylating) subunit CbiT n=1 Tax=Atrimonas thermophila TaxID=3064161 RepID=UPI00399C7EF7